MDSALVDLLRSLLLGRSVAALATLHDGRPFASMVPFVAVIHDRMLTCVTHVSGLSAHTRDMRANPDVCLMITAPESGGVPPQALPRISIVGRAEFVAVEHSGHDRLKAAYLRRFPEAVDLFAFADFSLVAIEPESARFVAGFARAMTLSAEAVAAALHEGRTS